MNNRITIDQEWLDIMEPLPEETRLLLIGAITSYQITGIKPELPPTAMMLFLFICPELNRRRRAKQNRQKRSISKTTCMEKSPQKKPEAQPVCTPPVCATPEKPQRRNDTVTPETMLERIMNDTAYVNEMHVHFNVPRAKIRRYIHEMLVAEYKKGTKLDNITVMEGLGRIYALQEEAKIKRPPESDIAPPRRSLQADDSGLYH